MWLLSREFFTDWGLVWDAYDIEKVCWLPGMLHELGIKRKSNISNIDQEVLIIIKNYFNKVTAVLFKEVSDRIYAWLSLWIRISN